VPIGLVTQKRGLLGYGSEVRRALGRRLQFDEAERNE
jgi:hypothetical protein